MGRPRSGKTHRQGNRQDDDNRHQFAAGEGRPTHPRIHTAMLMKAETLFSRRRYREAAETYNAIDATLVSESMTSMTSLP